MSDKAHRRWAADRGYRMAQTICGLRVRVAALDCEATTLYWLAQEIDEHRDGASGGRRDDGYRLVLDLVHRLDAIETEVGDLHARLQEFFVRPSRPGAGIADTDEAVAYLREHHPRWLVRAEVYRRPEGEWAARPRVPHRRGASASGEGST